MPRIGFKHYDEQKVEEEKTLTKENNEEIPDELASMLLGKSSAHLALDNKIKQLKLVILSKKFTTLPKNLKTQYLEALCVNIALSTELEVKSDILKG